MKMLPSQAKTHYSQRPTPFYSEMFCQAKPLIKATLMLGHSFAFLNILKLLSFPDKPFKHPACFQEPPKG